MSDPRAGSSKHAISRRRLALASLAFVALSGRARAEDTTVLTFDRLYAENGIRGLVFSETVKHAAGHPVALTGYMAPPLEAEANFFVLTREPMAICPFCQSDADWPADIVVVLLREATPMVSAGTRVAVVGRLEVGSATDPRTGFVSQLRIVDADVRRA